MIYNVNILSVFQPFLDRKAPPQKDNYYHERARTLSSASLRELRRLITLHETHHGWANAITLVIHAVTVASFGAPPRLDPNLEERSVPGPADVSARPQRAAELQLLRTAVVSAADTEVPRDGDAAAGRGAGGAGFLHERGVDAECGVARQ
jgi:hypothetical protein